MYLRVLFVRLCIQERVGYPFLSYATVYSIFVECQFRCLALGFDLCEKALTMRVAECEQIIAACHLSNVLPMEAVMYRFHPRMLALKQLFTSGELVHLLHTAFITS